MEEIREDTEGKEEKQHSLRNGTFTSSSVWDIISLQPEVTVVYKYAANTYPDEELLQDVTNF